MGCNAIAEGSITTLICTEYSRSLYVSLLTVYFTMSQRTCVMLCLSLEMKNTYIESLAFEILTVIMINI